VIGALNSKELQQKVEGKNIAGDVLSVKSRPDRRDPRQRGNLGLDPRIAEKL